MALYRKGSFGPVVELIQEALNKSVKNKSIPRLVEDGKFGSKTHEMTWEFQKENPPLKKDGIVGENTMKRLSVVYDEAERKRGRTLAQGDRTAGQGIGTYDCGYFAAYAIAEMVNRGGNHAGMSFTADNVLSDRDL